MERDAILATLQANRAALRQRGVMHVALFGSLARDEAGPGSDIDLLLDLDPAAPIDVFGYAGLLDVLRGMFAGRVVDVADRQALKPRLRPRIEREAILAF